MDQDFLQGLFGLQGKVAVVTGGAGVLCAAMSRALADRGVHVAVVDLRLEARRGSGGGAACKGRAGAWHRM